MNRIRPAVLLTALQALEPFQNPIEMNMSLAAVVTKLNGISGYICVDHFVAV